MPDNNLPTWLTNITKPQDQGGTCTRKETDRALAIWKVGAIFERYDELIVRAQKAGVNDEAVFYCYYKTNTALGAEAWGLAPELLYREYESDAYAWYKYLMGLEEWVDDDRYNRWFPEVDEWGARV